MCDFSMGKQRDQQKDGEGERCHHMKKLAGRAKEQHVSETLSLQLSISLFSSLMLKTATKSLKTAAVGTH